MIEFEREQMTITLARLHRCCWPMMPLELEHPGVLRIDDKAGNVLELIMEMPGELPDETELEGLA